MIPLTLKNRFWSLGGKTTALALVLAMVPLIFAGSYIFFQGEKAIRQGVADQLTSIAHLRVQVVNNWFRQSERGIEIAAIALRGAAISSGSGKEEMLWNLQNVRIRDELRKIIEKNDLFSEFFLLALDGEILLSTDEDNEGKLRTNRPYFIEGQKRTFLQNMYYSLMLEATASTIATPVLDNHDQVVAVLAGRIRLSTLTPLLLDRSGMGETGDTYLINKNNFYATDPRFAQGVAMKKTVYTKGVMSCLTHKDEGIAEYRDYRDEPVLGVHVWMPKREMCLIAEKSRKETLAPILSFRQYIIASFLAAFIFALLLAVRFSGQLTRPIMKILSGVTKIQSGNLHHQIVVKNKDELGNLADAFNEMSAALQNTTVSRDYAENITNAISDALFVLHPDNTIRFTNPAACKWLGYSENDLLGEQLGKFFEKQEQEQEEALTIDNYLLHKDGSKIPVEVSSSVLTSRNESKQDEPGKVLVLHDLRDRIKIEEAVRERIIQEKEKNELENKLRQSELEQQLLQSQKMESIGRLAGGIAHDFNNILQGMASTLDLIEEDLPEQSRVLPDVKTVQSFRIRASELVKQILTFSRYNTEKQAVVEVCPVLRECLKMLRAMLPKTIEIKERISFSQVRIMGNGTQIHQVIVNLCVNAGHAMEKTGGLLTVTLQNVEHSGQIPVTLVHGKSYLLLRIEDTGHGMPPEVLSQIFDPFFTTKKQGKGTGLGLSVIDGIIEMHKGHIHVNSEVGKGTVFEIYLPVFEDNEKPEKVVKNVPVNSVDEKRTFRILLVDDEKEMILSQQRMLKRMGHTAEFCFSADEALNILQENPKAFDLVITDQSMPVMTGLQLGRKCKELYPDLEIILSSGYSAVELPEHYEDAGIRALLPKPFSRSQLKQTINEVMAGRKQIT